MSYTWRAVLGLFFLSQRAVAGAPPIVGGGESWSEAAAKKPLLRDGMAALQSGVQLHLDEPPEEKEKDSSALISDHRADESMDASPSKSSSRQFWKKTCSQEVHASSAYDLESYGRAVAARLACHMTMTPQAEDSSPTSFNWGAVLQAFTGDLLVVLLAGLLAAAVHRPTLAALPDPYKALLTDEEETTYVQLPQLVAVLIAVLPGKELWTAAQAPLLFVLMGYGVSKIQAPPSKWMLVPLIVDYGLVLALFAALTRGSPTSHLQYLAQTLLPWELLSTEPSVGVHLAGLCFASVVACLLFSRALASICRGAGIEGLLLAYAWAWIGGPGTDHNLILSRIFGSEVLVSLPVRLQMHSFASGLVIGSWAKPSTSMQALGMVAMLVYAVVLPNISHPEFLHMMSRGALLPAQVFLAWAAAPLLTLQQRQHGRLKLLNLSSASVLLGPLVLSFHFSTLRAAGTCVIAFAAFHALETTLWWVCFLLESRARKKLSRKPENYRGPPEDLHFLGEYEGQGGASRRALWKALQILLFVGLLAASCRSAFLSVLGHKYGIPMVSSQWIRVTGPADDGHGRLPESILLPDWSKMCIPMSVMHGSVILPVVAWTTIIFGGLTLVANLSGMLRWPVPWREPIPRARPLEESMVAADRFQMIFRYCTRGDNPTLVQGNVATAFSSLAESGLPTDLWHIEVVTDNPMGLRQKCEGIPVVETVVHPDYKCPHGGRFKARALHYAVQYSELKPRPSDWIVHLDEETLFDAHTVCAIFQHCLQQNRIVRESNRQRVPHDPFVFPEMGQGAILYNTNGTPIQYHITALADTWRVGDDMGKFRLQSSGLGRALIGMHGSFAVINQAVEAALGFDLGEVGSITEDSYFACRAHAELNVGVRWIDGFMFEQSPFTALDLIKQRGRRYHGLFYCSLAARQSELKWQSIWGISLFLFAWSCSLLFLVACCFYLLTCRTNSMLSYALCVICEMWRLNYVVGFTMNFSPYREGWDRWLSLLILNVTLLLFPIGLLEIAGVLCGMYLVLTEAREFYIVKKEVR